MGPAMQEIQNCLPDCLGVRSGRAVARLGARDSLIQGETAPLLENNLHHPQRRTPQRVGILGAGGDEPDAEAAYDGIEPIRDGHRDPDAGGGQSVAGEPGQIMLLDGLANLGRLAGEAGVFPSHGSLQVGELLDHVGRKVRLAEQGGPLGRGAGGGVHTLCDPGGQALEPPDLVGHRPQLFLEDDLAQAREAGREAGASDPRGRRTPRRSGGRAGRARCPGGSAPCPWPACWRWSRSTGAGCRRRPPPGSSADASASGSRRPRAGAPGTPA